MYLAVRGDAFHPHHVSEQVTFHVPVRQIPLCDRQLFSGLYCRSFICLFIHFCVVFTVRCDAAVTNKTTLTHCCYNVLYKTLWSCFGPWKSIIRNTVAEYKLCGVMWCPQGIWWYGAMVMGGMVIRWYGDGWYSDTVIWWYGDTMIWWYGDMMIWWYGDMVIRWYDMMIRWYGYTLICWYGDTVIWWYCDKVIWYMVIRWYGYMVIRWYAEAAACISSILWRTLIIYRSTIHWYMWAG